MGIPLLLLFLLLLLLLLLLQLLLLLLLLLLIERDTTVRKPNLDSSISQYSLRRRKRKNWVLEQYYLYLVSLTTGTRMVLHQQARSTKSGFYALKILTFHSIIVKNALVFMHKLKNFPSPVSSSIKEKIANSAPILNVADLDSSLTCS